MTLHIQPMTDDSARAMLNWRYEPPYDLYNVEVDDDALADEIAYLTDDSNHYYAIYNDEEELIGHCVFKHEARVKGGDYSVDALDVGIGMRPFWTGQGKGTAIMREVIAFGRQHYDPPRFRATIAAWNQRARQVCLNNGFEVVQHFTRDSDDSEWVILMRDADVAAGS